MILLLEEREVDCVKNRDEEIDFEKLVAPSTVIDVSKCSHYGGHAINMLCFLCLQTEIKI